MSRPNAVAYTVILQLIGLANSTPTLSEGNANTDHPHGNVWFIKSIIVGIILFVSTLLAFYLYRHWKPMNRSQPRSLFVAPAVIHNPPVDHGPRRSRWFSRHGLPSRSQPSPSSSPDVVMQDITSIPKALVAKVKVNAPTMGPH